MPSTVLVQTTGEYARFLSAAQPAPLRRTRPAFLPRPEEEREAPGVNLIRFEYRAPKAKAVVLTGDFNGWDKGLPLDRRSDGFWQTELPLPAGEYHYLFEVDGRWSLDPAARKTARLGAQQVSVKVVR